MGVTDPQITPELRDWARGVIAHLGRKVRRRHPARRRALLVHLDGVPKSLLERHLARGLMPFLGGLLRAGAYRLDGAFWGSPSSTPSFQAGLLYGVRHPDLPAYLWYDRALGREVRMSTPKDTLEMERRLSRDEKSCLLGGGGTAYLSLFHGGASNRLSMASLATVRESAKDFARALPSISGAARRGPLRSFAELFGTAARSAFEVARWVQLQGDSRHEGAYLQNRTLIELLWDLSRKRAIVDMVRGVPMIYLVFGNYDEISHRRGPRSVESNRELLKVDAALAELYAVAHTLDEPYDVYFLTDHGHVDCEPFEKRQGRAFTRFLLDDAPEPLPEELRAALLEGRRPWEGAPDRVVDPMVVDAGNFAHLYLERSRRPMEAREILGRFPSLLARCAAQKDIGIAALRRGEGAVAFVRGGLYGPDELARAPLSGPFSRAAVADLLRELPHMTSAGDLVLYGDAVRPGGTVGFAWEFGSHGGLTRIETDSLVCWPTSAPADLSGLGHSVELYERLMDAYRSP